MANNNNGIGTISWIFIGCILLAIVIAAAIAFLGPTDTTAREPRTAAAGMTESPRSKSIPIGDTTSPTSAPPCTTRVARCMSTARISTR